MRFRALLLLVAYAGCLTPLEAVPQVLAAHAHQASAEFPCARHACGCRTASQCLLRCCCGTGGDGAHEELPLHPVLAAAACHGPGAPATAPSFLRRPHTPLQLISLLAAETHVPHHAAAVHMLDSAAAEPPEPVPRLA